MQAVIDEWTHVVAGSWNVAILNPLWVANKVFGGNINLQVELVVGPTLPVIRYSHQNVSITPSPNALVVSARVATPAAVQEASTVTCKILELLPVTPVTGVGVNFGYEHDEAEPEVAALFGIDSSRLADLNLPVNETSISRAVTYEDRTMNFRMTFREGRLRFHFNFHRDIGDGDQPMVLLQNRAPAYLERAEAVLRDLYSLEREAPNVH